MAKRITPLMVVLILGLGFWGVVIGAWYWTSQPMTMTISVTGQLDAKANVNPLTAWNGEVKVAFADLVESNGFFDGSEVDLDEGPKYIFVRLGDTNAVQFFTKVTATYAPGMVVSCEVSIVDRRGNIAEYPEAIEFWHDLGDIALDGSQSLQLIGRGEADYMLTEPDTHVRFAMYRFTVSPGTLTPGTFPLDVVIHIGDTA